MVLESQSVPARPAEGQVRDADLLSSLAMNESVSISRRSFLSVGGRAALGVPLLPLAACTPRDPAPSAAEGGTRWRPLIDYIEKEVPSLLSRGTMTPAAAIALVADAQLLWSRGFGVTDRTTNAPVNADTVFEFGSVSKTVFAYEVMKACDKGLLSLDTPLTNTRQRGSWPAIPASIS